MEYQCKVIPISRLPVSFEGVVEPLCTNCQSRDCSNNPEIMKVSVLGIMKKYKVLVRGGDAVIVIDCQGYIP
jgi:hypothetical protein